jgi:hypothetical protein
VQFTAGKCQQNMKNCRCQRLFLTFLKHKKNYIRYGYSLSRKLLVIGVLGTTAYFLL